MTTSPYVLASPDAALRSAGACSRRLEPDRDYPGLRIVLYSHDTQGLGHIRRNLLIAHTLAKSPLRPAILLITGARAAAQFTMPAGTDCLALPDISKSECGRYGPGTLGVSLDQLTRLRTSIICAALHSFRPDILIVDKVPLGVNGELQPGLELLHSRGQTRYVLGLRDILDDPEAARDDWKEMRGEEAIRRYYDSIWVYGDPRAYDLVREGGFSPAVASKSRYTGYLGRNGSTTGTESSGQRPMEALIELPGPLSLCLVGGGQDGYPLAAAFAQAKRPPGVSGLIVTGPYMPPAARRKLYSLAETQPHLHVLEFITAPELLMRRADTIVAMGGYNTVAEILSLRKPALIVPRVKPRLEQLIRAERLQALGMLDMLHPDRLTPDSISEWLARPVRRSSNTIEAIDLNGLSRIPSLVSQLMESNEGNGHVVA